MMWPPPAGRMCGHAAREQMKAEHRLLPQSVDGTRQGSWIVADYIDVVLHVFTPEARDYYRLEELWEDVPFVEPAVAR